jgi:hypothetical protein
VFLHISLLGFVLFSDLCHLLSFTPPDSIVLVPHIMQICTVTNSVLIALKKVIRTRKNIASVNKRGSRCPRSAGDMPSDGKELSSPCFRMF